MVSFNQIPAGIRVPGTYVEFDSRQAQQQPGAQAYTLLVIGQKLSAGTVDELVPTQIRSGEEASDYFGAGSMLHHMAEALFPNNRTTDAVFVAIDDPGGGSQSSGTVTFTTTTVVGGTVYLYIGGRRYTAAVTSSSTATTIAAAVAAAVNADQGASVLASPAAGVVTLTAKHAGTIGDLIDVRVNHRTDELTPSGVSIAIAPMSGGGGVVDVGEILAVLGETQYHVIANPYTDSANLDALEAELADRFGPLRQNEGVAIAAFNGTFAETNTFGDGRNSPHSVVVGMNLSPTTPWEYAAAVAGVVAFYGAIDPARPFQTLPVLGVLGPRGTDLWDLGERDLLLGDGIATTSVSEGGTVVVERLVTTYQETAQGVPDTAYLDLATLLTLGLIRYEVRNLIGTRFARTKLASDGTRAGAGSNVTTPSIVRAEMIALFSAWEERGLVENVDQFKADLIVEIDAQDPNRLNIYLPPNLVNGLRVVGAQIGFRL